MRSTTFVAAVAALAAPALGHFTLNYPTSRGSNHETQTTAPCGGLDSVVLPLTEFNMDGSPIATTTTHSDSGITYKFCPADADCTTNDGFSYTIMSTFFEVGAGDFCIPSVAIPESIYSGNTSEPLNGTLQVIYYSDDGDLYNCADISISMDGNTTSSLCVNATGVYTAEWAGSLSASEAEVDGDSTSSSTSAAASATSSSSSSASSAAASSTAHSGNGSSGSNSTVSTASAASSTSAASSASSSTASSAAAAVRIAAPSVFVGAAVFALAFLA
ncbi:uncharacterized protein V1518DRAFT_417217 [Limtongia smithiae]|uniref:uncharacterized protein n=1 Tax=Limtongia smithiae TaxID=1125753 RepID=UPI0034D0080A